MVGVAYRITVPRDMQVNKIKADMKAYTHPRSVTTTECTIGSI